MIYIWFPCICLVPYLPISLPISIDLSINLYEQLVLVLHQGLYISISTNAHIYTYLSRSRSRSLPLSLSLSPSRSRSRSRSRALSLSLSLSDLPIYLCFDRFAFINVSLSIFISLHVTPARTPDARERLCMRFDSQCRRLHRRLD